MFRILLTTICIIATTTICIAAGQIKLSLTDGTQISGEVGKSSFNQEGVVLMQNGAYGKRIPWNKLSQESLKKLAEYPDAQKYVEPLIEWIAEEKPKERPVPQKLEIKMPPRIERPKPTSAIGSLFQSPVTLTMLIIIYLANIYAGYEVAIFKNRQAILVCAVAAVLPIIGLALFMSLPPAPVKPVEELYAEEQQSESAAEQAETVPLPQAQPATQQPEQQQPSVPQTISYLRGQYTFNRRFFETKFAGFFKPVPPEEDKDRELVFVTLRGTFIGQKLTKVTQNEIYLLVKKGDASEEVMIPFVEIKEVHIKHKDVPFNGN